MSTSLLQPRLETKSSKIDDVPTFALGSSSTSEPLTFCNRSVTVSRPKPFYRPRPSQLRATSSADALFDDDDDEDDGNDEEIDMLVDDPAPPLIEIFTPQPREQRANRLMSNSAPEVGLSNRPAPRVHAGSQRRQKDRRPTLVCPSPRLPTVLVVAPYASVEVKQEVVNESAPRVDNTSTPRSDMFLSVVKDEPNDPTLPNTSTSGRREAASSTISTIPSIVVTTTTSLSPMSLITSSTSPSPNPFVTSKSAPPFLHTSALYHLFKQARGCTFHCLALIDTQTTHREQLLRCRSLAHHLLQESQTANIKLAAKRSELHARLLRELRDILKSILNVTAIVKLDPAAVQDRHWEEAGAKCARRLRAVVKLVDRMLSGAKPSLGISSS